MPSPPSGTRCAYTQTYVHTRVHVHTTVHPCTRGAHTRVCTDGNIRAQRGYTTSLVRSGKGKKVSPRNHGTPEDQSDAHMVWIV